MIASGFIVASAVILFTLGSVHLVYTFVGDKLAPRDPALQARMAQTAPGITRHASMWSFWVGFNISHSMAALLFGAIYGYLAVAQAALLFSSAYLLAVGLLMLAALFVTGWVYWFRAPLVGIGLALLCYVTGVAVALA